MEWTNLIKVLNTIGEEAELEYKEKIKNGAYATGKLYNSIDYKVKIVNGKITLSFDNLPDYYLNVEKGRKAGASMPPINVIEKWMVSKNIPNKPGTAFLIARSIGEKGIKAKPYLRDIKLKIKQNYTDDLQKALALDLNEQIKETLNGNINK